MKLYFKNTYGQRRVIAEPSSRVEAQKEMYKFCNDRSFVIHYIRTWRDGDGLEVYDVGSHTEFFLLDDSETENDNGNE